MSSSAQGAPGPPPAEPNHTRSFLLVWLISTVIALPLVILLVGPLLAPNGSNQATEQRTDMTVLAGVATPVVLLVMLFLLYTVLFFRQPRGAALEGPAVRGDARIQTAWIVITSAIILGLAAFGTVVLESSAGAGSGSGPNPVTVPSGPKLPVQVIAQQWAFTFRYPTYGGVETYKLELPVNKEVEFHVTSLDVVHSFWAYPLGVKADATPDVDNIAFAKATKIQSFEVRCSELCGIWHAAMRAEAKVVSANDFHSWIAEEQKKLAPATKVLPKYSTTYVPEPTRRAG